MPVALASRNYPEIFLEDAEPWLLRAEASRGLTREEVATCESGRSERGVSSTCIRGRFGPARFVADS